MIAKDLDWKPGTLQLGALFLKTSNDSQELFVIDLIVNLCGCEILREEYNRAENTVITILRDDTSGYIIRGIGLDDRLFTVVEIGKDQGRNETTFKFFKYFLLSFLPLKRDILLSYIG